jgi:TolB-like protein/Tfp pilus assembly protein PilF
VIGRFELLREIGRGGFGVVYEARDTSLGRLVAFKLVRGGLRMELRRDRLLREAEAAARLSHPNVVTLHDLGSSEHGPYLVLELLQGETLAARLRREPIPIAEALTIAVDIATGLAHAHAAGVIHGDVTPGNVFLCSDGRVKLLDLGLAQVFGSSESAGGTRGYMAPELRTGAPGSERSDVFALGVVLFKMVTGRMPYTADDERERPALRLGEAPELARVIDHMLSADAGDRPADASAVYAALVSARQQLEAPNRPAASTWTAGRSLLVVAAVMAALVAGALVLRGGRGGSGGSPPRGPRSVAVLPFVDRSPDQGQGYLAEGLADQLLMTLSRLEGVHVVGRASSFSLARDVGVDVAAHTLGVANVLVGSTRRDGDDLEVAAALHDAEGRLVWEQKYTRPMTDIFSVQDDIVAGAIRALGVAAIERKPGPSSYATGNTEAYTEYLRGRQQYYRVTLEGWRLAQSSFERAIALDPGYAPAWSGLAMVLFVMAEAPGSITDVELRALRQRALATAERAVALQPDLPDALSVRGTLLAYLSRDWPRAVADVTRALAIDPNNIDSLRRYGQVLACFGRLDEGIGAVEKAAGRDPLNPQAWAMLAGFYSVKGDLDGAERVSRRALSVSPDSMGALVATATTLLLQSRPQEALAVLARCSDLYRLAGTAMAEHSLGHPDRARLAIEELERNHADTAAYFLAEVHAWRDEKDLAIAWLERAISNGDVRAAEMRTDPLLARLATDPRFHDLLRRLELPVD